MAKYWNSSRLTITNIAPGSMVGVWMINDDGELDTDNHIFLGRVDSGGIDMSAPIDTEILVRVRGNRLRSFEMNTTIGGDTEMSVIQVRDD